MNKILLTFDLEEFDLPREFNCDISEEKMYEISREGLSNVTELLRKHNIKGTFFVTLNFAKKYPDLIRELDKEGHEIASHGYDHSFSNQTLEHAEMERRYKCGDITEESGFNLFG